MRAQAVAQVHEQAGAGRQVEHPDAIALRLERGGEFLPALVLGRVQRVVAELFQERRQLGLEQFVVAGSALQGVAHLGAVIGIGLLVAGHADDPAVLADLAIGVAAQQAGQQLAQGQITGASENHQIEGVDGQGLGGHVGISFACQVGRNNTTGLPR